MTVFITAQPPVVSVVSQMSPVHTLLSCYFNIRFSVSYRLRPGLTVCLFPLRFSTNSLCAFMFSCHIINPLNPELNPICYLLALLAHHFLHVSRIRVKSLTIRLLMSYIYTEHLFLIFLDHTQRRTTVGRTPLDE